MRDETLEWWEEELGPAYTWAGQCYGIAKTAVDKGLVDGVAVYGHWLGPISTDSLFADRRKHPFVQHGWIRTEYAIVDPTRWVFFGNEPFIWFGPLDSPEYDEGGNRWLQEIEQPPPRPEGKEINLPDLPQFFSDMIGDKVTIAHAFWLGNLSLYTLGDYALQVYSSLDQAGFRAAIPIDNWNRIMA